MSLPVNFRWIFLKNSTEETISTEEKSFNLKKSKQTKTIVQLEKIKITKITDL
jgi:hypothetical protein